MPGDRIAAERLECSGRPFHNHPVNEIPQRCSAFYRRQIANAINAGADMICTGMFDEINEGTVIFKLVVSPSEEPEIADIFALDADGSGTAASDTYLRIASEARLLRARR